MDALGGLTVTYSAFITRGTQLLETVSGEPVRCEEFPPPLGLLPLPTMRLLESAEAAVVIPQRKHVDTSCVVQFQVYAPVDGTGRRAMATLTFVDVAAFRLPLCKEVSHLVETVRRVAGVSAEGGDPGFKETALTTLLESALVGYVTLVSITTISGRPDLQPAACASLQFAADISRIHQVLMLTHINTPRWLFETGQNLEQLRVQRERIVQSAYSRGVYDYYQRASHWLLTHVNDVDGGLSRLLEETEEIRTQVAKEVSAQTAELQEHIQHEEATCRREVEAARVAYGATAEQFEEVKRLDESIATAEQQISQNDLQNGQRISEIRLAISALEAKTNNRRQAQQQLEKESRLYSLKTGEVAGVLAQYAEDLNYAQCVYVCTTELDGLAKKRARLEGELQVASQVAAHQTDHLRVDRERRSRLSRLTTMLQRVEALRETVRSSSASVAAPGGSSSRPSRPPHAALTATSKRSSSANTAAVGGGGGKERRGERTGPVTTGGQPSRGKRRVASTSSPVVEVSDSP